MSTKSCNENPDFNTWETVYLWFVKGCAQLLLWVTIASGVALAVYEYGLPALLIISFTALVTVALVLGLRE